RQPGRQVEPRVADTRPVPVDEQRAAVDQRDVVATYVPVEKLLALDLGPLGRADEDRQRVLEPVARAEPEREERLRIVRDRLPAAQVESVLLDARQPRKRRRRGQLVESGANCG